MMHVEMLHKGVEAAFSVNIEELTHYIKVATGFSREVDQMLVCAVKVGSCLQREKYVILLVDEMHICEDLVYDKHTGDNIWFCHLGGRQSTSASN